jgi:spore coat polysaccharide biosynthesis protein SpsF
MSIGVIVQARMSSSRLPGKVLREVQGRALLGHLLDGLRQAKGPDTLLVATSVDPSDDAVWRGPLDDVAARFLGAAEAASLDAAVRICADSPLLDPALVDQAVALFRLGGGRGQRARDAVSVCPAGALRHPQL